MLPAHIHDVTDNIYMLMIVCSGIWPWYCPDGSHNGPRLKANGIIARSITRPYNQ